MTFVSLAGLNENIYVITHILLVGSMNQIVRMNQKQNHTAPPLSSKAAAYGDKHVQSLASHSVAISQSVTKLTLSSSWITDVSGSVNQYIADTSTTLSIGFGAL